MAVVMAAWCVRAPCGDLTAAGQTLAAPPSAGSSSTKQPPGPVPATTSPPHVRDDGPGLDPELGAQAFEPGGRGGGDGGGAGLGLPLSRRLARTCGGDVVAGAGPGGCFVLELPALGGAARV